MGVCFQIKERLKGSNNILYPKKGMYGAYRGTYHRQAL